MTPFPKPPGRRYQTHTLNFGGAPVEILYSQSVEQIDDDPDGSTETVYVLEAVAFAKCVPQLYFEAWDFEGPMLSALEAAMHAEFSRLDQQENDERAIDAYIDAREAA